MNNVLIPILKKRIEEKFGSEVKYSFECDSLQKSIREETGQILSLTTLKRIMGFVSNPHLPRRSTLDILAQYIGFPDFTVFEKETFPGNHSSEFTSMESVDCSQLKSGDTILIRYNPDRRMKLIYEGDGWFEVAESINGKLKPGDRLKISQIVIGFRLFVSDVVRAGKSLGSYIGAKQGGIISIKKK